MGHQELIAIAYSVVINYPARPRLKRIDLRGRRARIRSAAATGIKPTAGPLRCGSLLIIPALGL